MTAAEPEITDDEILYHYTTGEGLLGIVNKRCIWCTDFSYLNDSSEAAYGSRLARESFATLEKDADPDVARVCAEMGRRFDQHLALGKGAVAQQWGLRRLLLNQVR